MIKSLYRYCRDSRGVAAIEMAFIMPFLLFLYFGLIDLTAMISLNRKVTYAASAVADLVTQNAATVKATDITDYFKAAELVLKPRPIADVRIEVNQFRKASGVITRSWHQDSTGGPDCTTPSTTGMDTLMTDGNDLIVAVVCTTYTPYVATFLGKKVLGATTFNMSEQIALRPRQSTALDCATCSH